jgi:hypothetical protein
MMKILALIVLLTGCATTAGTPTFSQLLATAETADDAVVVAATQALNAGSITSVQAQKVLTITDGVNAALTLANTTYQGGNLTSANAQIAAAMAILVTVKGCLAITQAKQSLDTCLAPVAK